MNIKAISNSLEILVKETGAYIGSQKDSVHASLIETKGLHDLVTHIDKNAEEKLVQGLEKILPEAGFIAEEGTSVKKGKTNNWIIDPVDGTTNFVHGIPPYSISVGLTENNRVILGAVYELGQDEYFHAIRGEGAWLNHQKISVSKENNIQNCLVGTGFPYNNFSKKEGYIKAFSYLMENTRGIRRYGSAAADLCYVACGRFDAFFEYSLNAWDISAGTLIIEEAGGALTDFNGGNDYLFSGQLIASNKAIFDSFSQIIMDAFK